MIVEVKIITPFGENTVHLEEQEMKELLNSLINKSWTRGGDIERPTETTLKSAPTTEPEPERTERENQTTPTASTTGQRITTRPQQSRNASLFGADWREQARKQLPAESRRNAARPAQNATKGFLICECELCHKIKVFCTKKPIKRYQCETCGSNTPLFEEDMKAAWADCECGQEFFYHTNATQSELNIRCIGCGREIHLVKSWKGYVTDRGQ